jgi:hypothetical protein
MSRPARSRPQLVADEDLGLNSLADWSGLGFRVLPKVDAICAPIGAEAGDANHSMPSPWASGVRSDIIQQIR